MCVLAAENFETQNEVVGVNKFGDGSPEIQRIQTQPAHAQAEANPACSYALYYTSQRCHW